MHSTLSHLLTKCKESGLRKTKSLVALLQTMTEKSVPVTITDLIESPMLSDQCDKVTIYRLLQRLNENGIIRRIGLHERSAYFILLLPDRHKDYLICTSCNHIEAIKAPCPVHQLEEDIAKQSGYKKLFHELEFFGICPSCAIE